MTPRILRGQIWWVDLGVPLGSAPGFRRPAAVVSSDRMNRSRIATVAVAAITSNLRLSTAYGNVRLPDDLLPKPSVINMSQILTVDRGQLIEYLAELPALERNALDDGLRLVVDL